MGRSYVKEGMELALKVYGTPERAVEALKRQLEVYDEVVTKYSAQNPLFKEIVLSQIAFARRALQWEQDTVVDRKMAYAHYWGPNGVGRNIR